MEEKFKKEAWEWGKALIEAIVILAVLKYVLNTPVPISTIASGSMRPTLERGDLVFVRGLDPKDIRIGNIAVYRSCQGPFIIHRVVGEAIRATFPNGTSKLYLVFSEKAREKLLEKLKGAKLYFYFITKGDNNPVTDYFLYQFMDCKTLRPLPGVPQDRVVGVVIEVGGYPIKLPYLGYVALLAFPFLWWVPR